MSGTTVLVWALRTLGGGGGLLLLAWLAMGRVRSPARRQRLGEGALASALLLAVLSLAPAWLLLPLPAEAPPPEAATQPPVAESKPDVPPAANAVAADEEPAAAQPWFAGAVVLEGPAAAPEPARRPAPPASALAAETAPDDGSLASRMGVAALALYLAGAAVMLGRRLLGHVVLWRLLREAGPPPREAARLFASMSTVGRRPRLRVSGRARVPFSCGVLRPTVVLPAALAAGAPPRVLRWVFAHELTHLRRRDAWSGVLLGLGQVVYFPLPWFWRLGRQVRLCQEYLADAAAAALGRPEDYAQFLLGWTAAPPAPAGGTGVGGRPSDLYRRITMLLQAPAPPEPRCPRRWSLPTAAGLLTLAVLVAGVGLAARAAPVPVRKDAPKKDEKKDDKKESKKEQDDVSAVLEQMLKRLPQGTDPDAVERTGRMIRSYLSNMPPEQLRQLREQMAQGGGPVIAPVAAPPGMMMPPGMVAGGLRNARLGARVEPPGATVAEQLELPKGQGLVLREVLPDSPAAKAGMKRHDILLELNGKPVPDRVDGLVKLLADIKPDAAVEVVVLRRGKKVTTKDLTLPEAAANEILPGGAPIVPGNFAPPLAPPVFPGAPGGFAPGGGQGVLTTVFRSEDRFTLRHQEGSLVITLTGKTADGKSRVADIRVQDGARSEKYEGVDKVPEEYRDKVKNLVEMAEKSSAKIEIPGK